MSIVSPLADRPEVINRPHALGHPTFGPCQNICGPDDDDRDDWFDPRSWDDPYDDDRFDPEPTDDDGYDDYGLDEDPEEEERSPYDPWDDYD